MTWKWKLQFSIVIPCDMGSKNFIKNCWRIKCLPAYILYIPKSGIKTHKCNKTQEIYPITTSLTCLSDNVVYKIACKKCKDFVYIGQTSNRFCDRFLSHKSYVTSKKLDQVCGAHFNLKGHSKEDMLPIILEQVHPKNDIHLLLNREKYWINTYQSIEFGSNTQFWNIH